MVSENGLVVTNRSRIYLFHIPGLKVTGNDSRLFPIWSWKGDVAGCHGALYKTTSPYPTLWLQGEQATHTLEFSVDESGCFPVVVNHRIVEGTPAYHVGANVILKSRKVMGVDIEDDGEIVFTTGVQGKPDFTRELRARLPGLSGTCPSQAVQDEMRHADFDEATGRIMFAAGAVAASRDWGTDRVPYGQRLCLADLPI